MPVVTLASSKGGCGKSTTALILASAYVADGYQVRIIDADRSARLYRWGQLGELPSALTIKRADDKTLRSEISSGAAECDLVIIDVEGSANVTVALAIGHADGVIVPANTSAPDVEDAVSTVQLIRDTEGMTGRRIPHALLWSRVAAAIRSREVAALEQQVLEGGITVLGRVLERTAYKSMYSFGRLLSDLDEKEVPGLQKARDEARVLGESTTDLIRAASAREAAA